MRDQGVELEIKSEEEIKQEPDYEPHECIICPESRPARWRVVIGMVEYPGGEGYELCDYHKGDIDTLFALYQSDGKAEGDAEKEAKYDSEREENEFKL